LFVVELFEKRLNMMQSSKQEEEGVHVLGAAAGAPGEALHSSSMHGDIEDVGAAWVSNDEHASMKKSWKGKGGALVVVAIVIAALVASITIGVQIAKDDNRTRSSGRVSVPSGTGPPSNDKCSAATVITPWQYQMVDGDTTMATPESAALFQQACSFGEDIEPTSGVWFELEGNGLKWHATAMQSSFDALISVYKEPDTKTPCVALECGAMTALTSNTVLQGNGLFHDKISAIWTTEKGVKYYVVVHGSRSTKAGDVEGDTVSGDFTLLVGPLVDNDQCEHAFGPLALVDEKESWDNSDGNVWGLTAGSVKWATEDSVAVCLADSGKPKEFAVGPGVWYTVVGTGKAMEAYIVCRDNVTDTLSQKATSFSDAYRTSVFEGSSCGALECVASYDSYSCPGLYTNSSDENLLKENYYRVAWDSEQDRVYYILVQGLQMHAFSLLPTSDFVIVTRTYQHVENDFCVNAIPLPSDGSRVSGTTEGATWGDQEAAVGVEDTWTIEGEHDSHGVGVWYTAVGTGENLNVVLFYDQSLGTDLEVSVYTGTTCGKVCCSKRCVSSILLQHQPYMCTLNVYTCIYSLTRLHGAFLAAMAMFLASCYPQKRMKCTTF
jgi:hypothetical protein